MVKLKTDLAKKGYDKYSKLSKKDKKTYAIKYTMSGKALMDTTQNAFFEFIAETNI